MRILTFIVIISLAAVCRKTASTPSFKWDANRALRDLQMFAAEPHPMGSARIKVLADYIDKEMASAGLEVKRQAFQAEVPDPELLGQAASMMRKSTLTFSFQNMTAKYASSSAEKCVYLVGSHYDSKRLEGATSIGANDSGSSSATLMELLRVIATTAPALRCHVMGVWFDGEEAYLPSWDDGLYRHPANQIDNTYGSRTFVSRLKPCDKSLCLPDEWGGDKVEGLILLDMVGAPALSLTPETQSTPELMSLAQEIDKDIFGGALYKGNSPKSINDDHVPFLKAGIPAVNIIGFENLESWHTPGDTIEKVSIKSMEQAAQLTDAMLRRLLEK